MSEIFGWISPITLSPFLSFSFLVACHLSLGTGSARLGVLETGLKHMEEFA